MDFFTDLMGLILLIVCILIVLIFLKDYIRLGGKKTTVNKKQKMIVYEVHQNNKRIQQGWITDDQLPFQFGRNAGSGNDDFNSTACSIFRKFLHSFGSAVCRKGVHFERYVHLVQ